MAEFTLRKKHLDALEKIWAAEIYNRLPFQSKAKIYKELEREGYVQPGSESWGRDRFGEMVVEGWYLTHLGRFAFCASCADVEVPDRG